MYQKGLIIWFWLFVTHWALVRIWLRSIIVPPQVGWRGVPGALIKTAEGNSPTKAKELDVNAFTVLAKRKIARKIRNFIFSWWLFKVSPLTESISTSVLDKCSFLSH